MRVKTKTELLTTGPGAFYWDGDTLRVSLPDPIGQVIMTLYPAGHAADDWSARGPKNSLSGTLDRPTLKHSIETPHWHGYLRDGKLIGGKRK